LKERNLVFHFQKILGGEFLVLSISPHFLSNLLMDKLSQSLSQTIGHSLNHNVIVVVQVLAVAFAKLLGSKSSAGHEHSYLVDSR